MKTVLVCFDLAFLYFAYMTEGRLVNLAAILEAGDGLLACIPSRCNNIICFPYGGICFNGACYCKVPGK